MQTEVERPLDLLNNLKGKIVELKLKSKDKPVKAQLLVFDIHINLVVIINKKRKFIRGDDVLSVDEIE